MTQNAEYAWDWVNRDTEEYVNNERRILAECYVVRRPDRSILCFTTRYKGGYEDAVAIAAAMNARAEIAPGWIDVGGGYWRRTGVEQ